MMHLDFHHVFAGFLDGLLQRDGMLRQFGASQFAHQAVVQILCCNRAKRFSRFAGFECKREDQLVDPAGELLGIGQFARFALSAFGSQVLTLRREPGVTSRAFPCGMRKLRA